VEAETSGPLMQGETLAIYAFRIIGSLGNEKRPYHSQETDGYTALADTNPAIKSSSIHRKEYSWPLSG